MSNTKIKAAQFHGVVGHGTDGYFLMTNADGSMSWAQGGATGPSVTSVAYPGDDLAADPAGNQTVVLTGTNFGSSMAVTIGGTTAPSVAHDSSTQLTITTPAKAAGDYDIVVTNTVTGASGTFVNGISYNGVPTWTTAAGSLGTFESETTISTITLAATEPDGGTITFNITNGALPSGLSLTGANIDGTTTAESSTTLYSFTIEAIDDENQATPRNFSITVNSAAIVPSQNFTINTYEGNGGTQSIEGKIGTAASFNGITPGGSVITTNSTAMQLQEMSVSAWINMSALNTLNMIATSAVKQPQSSGDTGWTFSAGTLTQNGLKFASVISGAHLYQTVPYNFSLNTWYQVAFTRNSSGLVTFYVNGNSIGTDTRSGTIEYVNNPTFSIGGSYYLNQSYWSMPGKIDQVRLFNKELSSSEVTTLYNEPSNLGSASTTDIFGDGSAIALYEFEKGAKDTGGASGYIGVGGIFNGSSSYIDAPSLLPLFGSKNTNTVSLWFRTTTTIYSTLFTDHANTSLNNTIDLNASGDIEVFTRYSNSTSAISSTSGNYNDGDWHNVVHVVDISNLTSTLYIDGSQIGSSASISSNSWNGVSNQKVTIGAVYYPPISNYQNYFNGKIDQVRIFDKALSSSEVTTLSDETSASSTKSTTDIFDDGSGVALYELEGNANDSGIDYGTSTIDSGQSAVFNGSNGVIDLGSNLGLANNSFSFSFWAANRATTAHSYFIAGGTQASNQGLHVGYRYTSGKFTLAFYSNDLDSNTSMSTDGTWEHWACTYDATTNSRKIYYNGVLDASDTATADFQSTANIKLGLDPGNAYANGDLDDVRIYSDVLTDYEIKRIVANDTANIPTSNLTAHYKLNGNANDETGTYNGTASNITYTNPAKKPGVVRAYNGTATNVTYGYDGTPTDVSFVGTSFEPDLVWIKPRTNTNWHQIYDSVRGVAKAIFPNDTYQESSNNSAGYLNSFDLNGFTVQSGSVSDLNVSNTSHDYVAWCWKAGGTVSANNNADGTITSTVSANQDAGFSIVKWAGSDANDTVGHGLSVPPELIILKNLAQSTGKWATYNHTIGSTKTLYLNESAGEETNGFWQNTSPTSNVFYVSGQDTVNGPQGNIIAYCFHSIDGYQKIGSYTGTGSSGNVVTTGFRPRFVMYKLSSSSGNSWVMIDDVRSPSNPRNKYLFANASNQEGTTNVLNFIDNGFELLLTDLGTNALNETYIYLAIA